MTTRVAGHWVCRALVLVMLVAGAAQGSAQSTADQRSARVDTLYRTMFANAARGTGRSKDDVSFQALPGPQRRVPLHVTPGPLWSPSDDTTGGPDARAIRALREQSNAAILRHDTAGIAAILAPHVVVVTSNSRTLAGRDAMIRSFAEQFESRPDVWYRRTPSEVKVFGAWGMASEEGRWTGAWTDPDGPLTIGGIYFAKWRQLDGRWLVESETYVPDRCRGGLYCRTPPARP